MAIQYLYAGLAAFQLLSGLQQAETIRANGRLTKEIYDMNAEFSEIDSFEAIQDGQTNVAFYEGQADQVESDARAVYAAQDVDFNYGSAAEVIADSKLATFLNTLDIKNQARAKALGYKNQARQYVTGGMLALSQSEINASATQNAAIINAADTGLTGYAKYSGAKSKLTGNSGSTASSSEPVLPHTYGHNHWGMSSIE